MKKIRAVVEISVPDKVNLTEMQFAKLLRRDHAKNSLFLGRIEQATRPLQFKEFGRVVQYGPDGTRIVPTRPPSSFERLVLFGLWAIIHTMISPRQLSKSVPLQKWFRDVRATLLQDEDEPREEEEPFVDEARRAAGDEQMRLHEETLATARKEGRVE